MRSCGFVTDSVNAPHSQLWPLHRLFCGPGKANPFKWPPLSREEADFLLEHLHTPWGSHESSRSPDCDVVSIYQRLQQNTTYAKMTEYVSLLALSRRQGSALTSQRQVQDSIHKATLPGHGDTAFTLRACEYISKHRGYPTVPALMNDLSLLTWFSHIAHMLTVCEKKRFWLSPYLHRLSVVALLEFEMCKTEDKAHLKYLAHFWQAPCEALIAFVQEYVVPSEPALANALLSFHTEVRDAVSRNIVEKLAILST